MFGVSQTRTLTKPFAFGLPQSIILTSQPCTVGAAVGLAVGDGVGLAVGDVVGLVVGDAVGAIVGLLVGDVVGDVVGLAVGVVVGLVVGEEVGWYWQVYLSGPTVMLLVESLQLPSGLQGLLRHSSTSTSHLPPCSTSLLVMRQRLE